MTQISVTHVPKDSRSKLYQETLEWMHEFHFGDGTCGSENIKQSCFAAEYCGNESGNETSSMRDTHSNFDQYYRYILDKGRGQSLRSQRHESYVARRDGVIVGFVYIVLQGKTPKIGIVRALCASMRRRGVASAILRHVTNRYADITLKLTVAHSFAEEEGGNGGNEADRLLRAQYPVLVRLYEKFGFRFTDDVNGERSRINMIRNPNGVGARPDFIPTLYSLL